MPIRKYKPTSPGRRFQTVQTFDDITATEPYKPLTEPLRKSGGRNNTGELTSWWRGGGHKRKYRVIDFKRDKRDIPAKVSTIEYDPNRSSRIALVTYADGEKRYILQPAGLKVGDTIVAGESVDILPGNALPLRNIPLGTTVHNVELKPGKGGQMARSAGAGVQVVAKEGDYVTVRMPSSEVRLVNANCLATIGQVGNVDHENVVDRQGGAQPLARVEAAQPRRGDEPGGSPARRRRRQDLRRPASGDALGRADQGLQDAQQQADGPLHRHAEAEVATREKVRHEQITEEGPVRRDLAAREDRGDEPGRREEGHQDLVAPVDGHSRDGGAHARGAQRQEVRAGVHHGEHGRPQARGVRGDADLQGPHDEDRQGGGAGQGGRGIAMVQAHATAKLRAHVGPEGRARAGPDSRQERAEALATLKFARKGVARDMQKVLRSAVANAQQKDGFGGDVERLFVSACYANQGPSQKRVRPAPMGRAFRVVKRTAHLTVAVTEKARGTDGPGAARCPAEGDAQRVEGLRSGEPRSRTPAAKKARA